MKQKQIKATTTDDGNDDDVNDDDGDDDDGNDDGNDGIRESCSNFDRIVGTV